MIDLLLSYLAGILTGTFLKRLAQSAFRYIVVLQIYYSTIRTVKRNRKILEKKLKMLRKEREDGECS